MEAINIWPTSSSSFSYSIQQSQENVSKEDTTTYHQPHLHLFLGSSSLLRCICLLFSMCHNVICLLSPVITPVLVTVDSFRVLVVVRRNYSGRVSVHALQCSWLVHLSLLLLLLPLVGSNIIIMHHLRAAAQPTLSLMMILMLMHGERIDKQ